MLRDLILQQARQDRKKLRYPAQLHSVDHTSFEQFDPCSTSHKKWTAGCDQKLLIICNALNIMCSCTHMAKSYELYYLLCLSS